MSRRLCSFALAAAVGGGGETALAEEEVRPGTALSPEQLPAEPRYYERLLRDDSVGGAAAAEELGLLGNDTVDERRHFDDRKVHLGLGTGLGTPVGLLGAYVEANPWDGLALGAGAGVTAWGPAGGVLLRVRPYVWGGQGQRALHAFTLQTSYTYMLHGREPLGDVDISFYRCEVGACPEPKPEFIPQAAHFMSLSAGFEHALLTGWTFRYDLGFAQALKPTTWECAFGPTPAPCESSSPSDTVLVLAFAFSHAL